MGVRRVRLRGEIRSDFDPIGSREQAGLWSSLRQEWLLSMRRKKIHPTVIRRSLLFLDQEMPGTIFGQCTVEQAWEQIMEADQNFRQATNTMPATRRQ